MLLHNSMRVSASPLLLLSSAANCPSARSVIREECSKMGDNNNTKFMDCDPHILKTLREKYEFLVDEGLKLGLKVDDLRNILMNLEADGSTKANVSNAWGASKWVYCVLGFSVVVLGVLWNPDNMMTLNSNNSLYRRFLSSRCILANNFFVMEIARPIMDCNICRNVSGVVVLANNVSRETFGQYAYAGRPILVKGAAKSWNATMTFSFEFFKKLYLETDGALQSVDEECQFFPFLTEFVTLLDVFSMPLERAKGLDKEKPWYIGWSNCNPQVAEVLRKHYNRPHFLPDDSESSAIDWIFMGWSGQGASVHLDYVQRPSWQAQLSGHKTWRMFPTPECEDVCSSFTFTVEKGDIVLIDTNQWYHDTFINPGEISITIGSEYD